jgi:hypothetical protein
VHQQVAVVHDEQVDTSVPETLRAHALAGDDGQYVAGFVDVFDQLVGTHGGEEWQDSKGRSRW